MNTFGIEFEVVGIDPRTASHALAHAGLNARAESYNHETVGYWKAVTDGSLRNRLNANAGTAEVVSPVLNVSDFDQVKVATNALKAAGARVNISCGTHVHIGGFDLEPVKVYRAAKYYELCWDLTAKLVPASRLNGNWARRLDEQELNAIKTGRFNIDRYRAFNVAPINRQGTIEFRLHQGTLNATKILAWADYSQAMVNYAQDSEHLFWSESLHEHLNNLTQTGYLRAESANYLLARAEELASR